MIPALAWRNIWRQPTRTVLSVTGMALTAMLLVFMLSFQLGTYDTMKASMLKVVSGYGQFQAPGYRDDPAIDRAIPDPDSLIAEVLEIPGITAATPRATAFVLLVNGERSFAGGVVGIDPATEARVTTLSTLVTEGRALRPGDDAAIVLGAGLARNLRVTVGDRVTLLGTGADGSVAADVLTLVGIFRSNVPEIDRQFARMPLARFRETFQTGTSANVVAITGRSFQAVVAAEPRLRSIAARRGLVYLDWGQIQPFLKQAITLDFTTAMTMYATLVVVVVFIILNTLYMSVLERTREFGVLLAIGMTPGRIGRMVWMEIVFLALTGNGIGILLGIAVTAWFQRVGISFEGMEAVWSRFGLPPRIYPAMTPLRVLAGPGAVTLAIGLLGVIPYRRVMGLKPVPAMAA